VTDSRSAIIGDVLFVHAKMYAHVASSHFISPSFAKNQSIIATARTIGN
jgi:hypothetical protein